VKGIKKGRGMERKGNVRKCMMGLEKKAKRK